MTKIALVAGGGELPLEFIRSAKRQGDEVVVYALRGMANEELEKEASKIYWVGINEYAKFAFLLVKERIRQLAMIGKVEKTVIYSDIGEKEKTLKELKNKKDYSILEEITRQLKKIGVEVVDGMKYLSHMVTQKGVLTSRAPDAHETEDIKFGYDTAKKLAGMDIGQTLIVKGGAIVSVEAMEGTDETISRAAKTAGEGCVMIKVSRPDQDMRWDVPAVGPETIDLLAENKYSALALESDKMYLLNKEEFIKKAEAAGIAVEVL
ncbi:MAG: UDP-2,3-diacylglucosamine diphosphatase LpxI [Candidatus Omnitrophica bacterium]|nr:UDP-2,3-diacylglucosamine diphosphatase LpxI [Candidatus Omnitrophota bacterium]